MRRLFALIGLGVAFSFASSASPHGSAGPGMSPPLRMPLLFEANEGQTDLSVRFLGRAAGLVVYLTSREAVLQIEGAETPRASVLRMHLVDGNPNPHMAAIEPQPARVHYFVGNDPDKWRRNVPTYARVRYDAVYPGIDAIYYGNERNVEFDFNVAPGADPSAIAMRFEGASHLALDASGDLLIQVGESTLRQHKPVVYQTDGGARRTIAARYVIGPDGAIRFGLGSYDRERPLVIDPVLTYATLLGGSGTESVQAVAVDPTGNAVVAGFTQSTNFPLLGALPSARGGTQDAFVSKFDPAGALLFSTYLGGAGSDSARAITTDVTGNMYVAGFTTSSAFPTVSAFQSARQGTQDGLVARSTRRGARCCSRRISAGRWSKPSMPSRSMPPASISPAGRRRPTSRLPGLPRPQVEGATTRSRRSSVWEGHR